MSKYFCAIYWNGTPRPIIDGYDRYILDPREKDGKDSSAWSCALTDRESLGCGCCETATIHFLSPDAPNYLSLYQGYQLTKDPYKPTPVTCILLRNKTEDEHGRRS